MPLPLNSVGEPYRPEVHTLRKGCTPSYYWHGAGAEGRNMLLINQKARPLTSADIKLYANNYTRELIQAGMMLEDEVDATGRGGAAGKALKQAKELAAQQREPGPPHDWRKALVERGYDPGQIGETAQQLELTAS